MKKNVKVIAATLIALVAGYVAGAYLGLPGTTDGNGSGDISKASKYNKASVTAGLSAYQERIISDSTEMAKAALSLATLTSRMKEFSSLVNVAADASEGYPELKGKVDNLLSVKGISDNAVNAGRLAIASFNSLASGMKDPQAAAYEQTSQNLTIAYLMVDRQITLGKEYVASVDKFLKGKNAEEHVGLACARDLWSVYCAGNAKIDGNQDEMEYWAEQGTILDSDTFANAYKAIADSTLNASLALDNLLGLADVLSMEGVLENFGSDALEGHMGAELEIHKEETLQGHMEEELRGNVGVELAREQMVALGMNGEFIEQAGKIAREGTLSMNVSDLCSSISVAEIGLSRASEEVIAREIMFGRSQKEE